MKLNRFLIIAILFIICGIALLGYSTTTGEGSAGVFFIIPYFHGSGLTAFLGMMCIMGAMLFGFLGFASQMEGPAAPEDQTPRRQEPGQQPPGTKPRPSVKTGGVVLIGPIPIIFGSDPKLAVVLAILAIVMIVMMFFFFYL